MADINLNSKGLGPFSNVVTEDVGATLNWLASGSWANPYAYTAQDNIFSGNGASVSGPNPTITGADVMAANEALQQQNNNAQSGIISSGAFNFETESVQNDLALTLFQTFAIKSESLMASLNVKSGCCFIFIEVHDGLDPVVRRYRDEHMTDRNRRGYYRLADVIVPIMQRSEHFKRLVARIMVKPMTTYGRWFYGLQNFGKCYEPITKMWLKFFDLLGFGESYIRKNGELI